MRKMRLLILVMLVPVIVQAQYTRHIIRFKDKNNSPYTIDNPAAYLSEKAIARRVQQQIPIDTSDLPVSPAYLDSIRKVPNVTILNTSRWLNQVLIQTTDEAALATINSFPFVQSTKAIAPVMPPQQDAQEEGIQGHAATEYTAPDSTEACFGYTLAYGSMYKQIHLHEGEYLHNLGFTGNGITIALLDAGFNNYQYNPALDSLRLQNRILGEWDFVENHASVQEDHPHGTQCLSVIASNRPGILVGSAPHARFWLFRTENTLGEFPVEEQNWIAAAEFADSAGADMIASSLGYAQFDNPDYNYSYADRDGNTSMITRAADLAAKKGMIVVNSAGNFGTSSSDLRYVLCPADGDSVLAVGGIDEYGQIVSLSSWGPNSNGVVKPNVVSLAQGAIYANGSGNASSGIGTSYAAPNICGLIACLWQAFPEFTNMEILDYVQKSADRYDNPDHRYGYGIPNFRVAHKLLAAAKEARRSAHILSNEWIRAYPVPSAGNFTVLFRAPATARVSLQLIDNLGNIVETLQPSVVAGQFYSMQFVRATGLPHGLYYVRYNDGVNTTSLRVLRQ